MSVWKKGQIAQWAEDTPCYCGDGKKHWHAVRAVFDGEAWQRVDSPEGFQVFTELADTSPLSSPDSQ